MCEAAGVTRRLRVEGGTAAYLFHGNLHKCIPIYWWLRTRATVPLRGEVFDFSGFLYDTACSVFQGTTVALHTDSLVMIYSLKHQSPDNNNYQVVSLLFGL